MKNIQIVQSAWISRKVQKISASNGADWIDLINDEINNIKNSNQSNLKSIIDIKNINGSIDSNF